jgi:ribose transport system ATP-binding protein
VSEIPPADATSASCVLSVAHVSKTFPGQRALIDVDLEVTAGEIHALVGQNGSGKSTLIKILCGFHQPDSGWLASAGGDPMELGSAKAATEAGLRFIHQELALVRQLDAVDNLALGGAYKGRWWLGDKAERTAAREALAQLELDIDVTVPVQELPAAQRTMLAIARAMGAGPGVASLLVLDEPTASLPTDDVRHLFNLLRRLRSSGGSVLYISHRLDEIFELADRVTVLRDGRRVATRPVTGLDHADLVELIVGRPLDKFYPDVPVPGSDVALRVQELSGDGVDSMSFEVRAGEIVGVAGLLGSGRDELPYLLFGAHPRSAGQIAIGGTRVSDLRPHTAMAAGMAFVPPDRKHEGILPLLTVRENITLPAVVGRGPARWLSDRREGAEVRHWLGKVNLVPADPERPAGLLSGGNQQKAVLARWLRRPAKVFVVAEPTQGVDVGAKVSIYEILAEQAGAGTAVLISSSDTEELAAICDRVLVMTDGRLTHEVSGEQLTVRELDYLLMARNAVGGED